MAWGAVCSSKMDSSPLIDREENSRGSGCSNVSSWRGDLGEKTRRRTGEGEGRVRVLWGSRKDQIHKEGHHL